MQFEFSLYHFRLDGRMPRLGTRPYVLSSFFISIHICHIAFVTLNLPQWIFHIAFVKLNLSHCICHIAFVTFHSSHCICHNAFVTVYMSQCKCHGPSLYFLTWLPSPSLFLKNTKVCSVHFWASGRESRSFLTKWQGITQFPNYWWWITLTAQPQLVFEEHTQPQLVFEEHYSCSVQLSDMRDSLPLVRKKCEVRCH